MRASFELPSAVVDRVIAVAIDEDLSSGDVTTEACIDARASAVAHPRRTRMSFTHVFADADSIGERVYVMHQTAVRRIDDGKKSAAPRKHR